MLTVLNFITVLVCCICKHKIYQVFFLHLKENSKSNHLEVVHVELSKRISIDSKTEDECPNNNHNNRSIEKEL